MTATKTRTYLGVSARWMKPMLRHRPALYENMLGTVWAVSPAGEHRYFGYNHAAAKEWAQVDAGADPRLFRSASRTAHISRGQVVLYLAPTTNNPNEIRSGKEQSA